MLLRKVRILAAKIETNPGEAATLAAADGTFNVFDLTINPNITMRERAGQGGFTPLPAIVEGQLGSVTFTTEVWSATATPVWATTFLPCSGFKETASVFAPRSEGPGANLKTCTIGVYENGRFKRLRGCSGTFRITAASGKVVLIEWTFTGIWDAPEDVAIIAPTYVTNTPLRFADAGLVLNGDFSPKLEQMTIDIGNEVFPREDPNDPSGYCYAMITGRVVKITMNPEATLVATKNLYAEWLASTLQSLELMLGSGDNRLAIEVPKLQIMNIQDGDRNGLIIDQLDCQAVRDTSLGNDEISLDFTEDTP